MGRYVTQRGVQVETSAENAAAMGYKAAEQQQAAPAKKKTPTRRREPATVSTSDED